MLVALRAGDETLKTLKLVLLSQEGRLGRSEMRPLPPLGNGQKTRLAESCPLDGDQLLFFLTLLTIEPWIFASFNNSPLS